MVEQADGVTKIAEEGGEATKIAEGGEATKIAEEGGEATKIADSPGRLREEPHNSGLWKGQTYRNSLNPKVAEAVSYTHLRAHET